MVKAELVEDGVTKTQHISMWSGPRNISTTMMRSFENRSDTQVVDEPFYASYLERSGADHPFRDEILAAQPTAYEDALAQVLSDNEGAAPFKFHKHIAFHLQPDTDLDWVLNTRCILLIRDPRAMVASYADRFEDVSPIVASLAIERRIFDLFRDHKQPCPIIDSKDVLCAPQPMLEKLCRQLDIPFDAAMLAWPEGPRESDGVWAPHWYHNVEKTSGFLPWQEKTISLSPELEQIADACREDYDYLYQARLTV